MTQAEAMAWWMQEEWLSWDDALKQWDAVPELCTGETIQVTRGGKTKVDPKPDARTLPAESRERFNEESGNLKSPG